MELSDIGIKEEVKTDVQKLLDESIIDTSLVLERPPTILSIKEKQATQTIYKRILSLGNFSVFKGKKKSRKTSLAVLICGALLKERDYDGKLLSDLPKDKKLILFFDTEQSQYDSWATIKKIESLAGHKNHLRGLNLRPYTVAQRIEIITHALKLWGKYVGYVVIDGLKDLVDDINNAVEGTNVCGYLMQWTHDYNCHITIVIHENKADTNARGHIGTEVENKAEVVVSVTEIQGNWKSSDVKFDFCRSIKPEPFIITIEDNLPYVDDYIPESSKRPQMNYYESHIIEILQNKEFENNENEELDEYGRPKKPPF
jgi:hypothetical protein